MRKALLLPPLFALVVVACSSSSSPAVDDAGVSPDAAAAGDGDTGTDAADAGSADGEAPACATATCKTQDDCQKALGGVAGCWQCKVGCCAAIADGQDPGAACATQSTACTKGVCNGGGGCSKANLSAGTACGTVCNPNKADQKVAAVCDGNGVCAINFPGGPSFTNCTTGTCTGSSDKCSSCPASGCTATCAVGGPAPSCP